jgi:hypothetical protein
MKNTISVKQLGLDEAYLLLPKDEKEMCCITIVEAALKHMKQPPTKKEKIEFMRMILTRSIEILEPQEEFENCQILLDLKNALDLI